jgi:hypothetical protein
MGNPTKIVLSGSTDGKPIPVDTATHTLTVEWGGTSDPGDYLVKAYSISPNSSPVPIALGEPIQNSLVIKAFADSASMINIIGFVLREV